MNKTLLFMTIVVGIACIVSLTFACVITAKTLREDAELTRLAEAELARMEAEQIELQARLNALQEADDEEPITNEMVDEWILNEDEFKLVCATVMAEGNQHDMYIAVAQCIKNGMEIDGLTAAQCIHDFKYAEPYWDYTEEVRDIVYDVFFHDLKVTDAPILYFYATDVVYSEWHETQEYVMTIDKVRFFARKGA